MSEASAAPRRLSGRGTLERLGLGYAAALVALAAAIWLELPSWLAPPLLVVALALAGVTAICAARTLADYHASLPYRKRPSFSGRGVGALALVLLGLLPIACAYFVYPRSWPTSVEEAVAQLSRQLDAGSRRQIAYMGYDELGKLQDTLGASLRQQFGLNRRNFRLAYDCDAEYMNPHTCSSIIISRLWKKLRDDLPEAERTALERLEKDTERVRLSSQQFQNVPLRELVEFLNDAIRKQIPERARPAVVHDPALSTTRISTSWHAVGTISLREALAVIEEAGEWRVRQAPPNLVLERSSLTR